MRFDDLLTTVLRTERRGPAAWRQLVDLVGRGRVPADGDVMAELEALARTVPADVRAASARALAGAEPPGALVRLLARDVPAVSAPVLRHARLSVPEWIRLLPELAPEGRATLRHRRDLPREIEAALAGFAPLDFLLPAAADPAPIAVAVRPAREADTGTFRIAEVVARIEAFREKNAVPATHERPSPTAEDRFAFVTDADGTIRGADTVYRGAVVGLSIARIARPGGPGVDGTAAGAFRRRSRIARARLAIAPGTPMAGAWTILAEPQFDRATGRFTGYRGDARRLDAPHAAGASDALRQVVHELRTPTNAIQGFAEMIATEMLGPVAPAPRERAQAICADGGRLMAAIGDLDTASRIDGGAPPLAPEKVSLAALLRGIAAERPSTRIALPAADATVVADRRQLDRMIGRLIDLMSAAVTSSEVIGLSVHAAAGERVALSITRPRALAAWPGDALLAIDDETAPAALIGTGFALRLVRRLGEAIGGTLVLGRARLTLYLPIALDRPMGRTRRLM